MQVSLKDVIVDVEIIHKNNKYAYFRFEDNLLKVTCNRFTTERSILKTIKENEDSLYKLYLKSKKHEEINTMFSYLGDKYTIVYDNTTKVPYFDSDMIFVSNQKILDKFYLKECERIFTSEVERILPSFKDIPKFTLKLRKMKTKWGVNNITKRTITLNTELLKYKIHLLDYVIIHELCHFYEANHSAKFWEHVAKYYPDYKKARKELR